MVFAPPLYSATGEPLRKEGVYMSMIKDVPLSCEEVRNIIEGKGAARRVPIAIQPWVNAGIFGERENEYRELINAYPCDIEVITLKIPEVFEAPNDAASYRWMNKDNPFPKGTALDSVNAIADWDELDGILNYFPDPNYHGLIPANVPDKGEQYRVAHWWYWLFERLWSLRGMENALCDFYEAPERIHQLFRALTDFYKTAIERAHYELKVDAIWTSDDIGMQTGPFFSLKIFRNFFKPYYKELIEHAHSMGMHFCGNITQFIPELIEIGLDVLHPIQKYTMDEREIAKRYGDKLCIWAGFDVQRIIPYGTAEEVREEVRFMLDTYFREDGRLIMAAGNNMTEDTPFESLEALLDETLVYGGKLCMYSKSEQRG